MRAHTWEPLVPAAPLAAESPSPLQGGAIRRKWLVALFVLLLAGGLVSERLAASLRVYTRREGTTVQPHQRSNLGGNPLNNYRFPGNSHGLLAVMGSLLFVQGTWGPAGTSLAGPVR
jgi:hypothetical protein